MLDIYEMSSQEIQDLLQQVGYGHLGCTYQGHPYVVPMNYYLNGSDLYLFTTEGMKTLYMDANPEVCLQVEDLQDLTHWCWQSVMVKGWVDRITDPQEIESVLQLIKKYNPTFSPAISRTWIDTWGRANIRAIYRLHPIEISGRKTIECQEVS